VTLKYELCSEMNKPKNIFEIRLIKINKIFKERGR
jgi:hypothetical protein